MEELESHGWKADLAQETEDINDIDMKAMFKDADNQRRDSVELVVAPSRRVKNKMWKNIL